jgi:hypothetical protein
MLDHPHLDQENANMGLAEATLIIIIVLYLLRPKRIVWQF